jgi:hypothetical protein
LETNPGNALLVFIAPLTMGIGQDKTIREADSEAGSPATPTPASMPM